MAGIIKKNFDAADEVRTPPKTRVEVVSLPSVTAARFTFEPGWRWSEAVGPVAGTTSCQLRHVGAVVSGQLEVTHEDESLETLAPGDAYTIEPGHDARVIGDEPFVCYEFESKSAETYATGG